MSAATMRRMVELARAKKRKKEEEQNRRSLHNRKNLSVNSNLQRGKTQTNVRGSPDTAEERVKKRLSVNLGMAPGAQLHVRSYSLPKEKTNVLADLPSISDREQRVSFSETVSEPESSLETDEGSESRDGKGRREVPSAGAGGIFGGGGTTGTTPGLIAIQPPMLAKTSDLASSVGTSVEYDDESVDEEDETPVQRKDTFANDLDNAPSLNLGGGGDDEDDEEEEDSPVIIGAIDALDKTRQSYERESTDEDDDKAVSPDPPQVEVEVEAEVDNIQTLTPKQGADPVETTDSLQPPKSGSPSRQSQADSPKEQGSFWSCLCCCGPKRGARNQRQQMRQQIGSTSQAAMLDYQETGAGASSGSVHQTSQVPLAEGSPPAGSSDGDMSKSPTIRRLQRAAERDSVTGPGGGTGSGGQYGAVGNRGGGGMGGVPNAPSLEMDDDEWKTMTSVVSRLRRPTAFSTATRDKRSTIDPNDIRMWEEPFGKGAGGRVFRAMYMPICQIVAAKVTSRLDKHNVNQLLQEFEAQQNLLPECEQLMRIFGWYRDMVHNEVVVMLEYMDMGSIYDSCFPAKGHALNATQEEMDKSGHQQILVEKLSYDQLRWITRETLLGLYALHNCSKPLIHRDIKPQNILLSSFGEVKVADFGLLFQLRSPDDVCTDQSGTAKYFAPERVNANFGCGVDIWALGITLIEIFQQELIPSDQLDFFSIVEEGVDVESLLPPTAPTEFTTFVQLCLTMDANNRPSARDLLRHPFVTRKWGPALTQRPNLTRKRPVQFAEIQPNHKVLDKLINWLEEWICANEETNARLFEEGDDELLTQCVLNLARYSGLPPKYIDTYIADVYRELIT